MITSLATSQNIEKQNPNTAVIMNYWYHKKYENIKYEKCLTISVSWFQFSGNLIFFSIIRFTETLRKKKKNSKKRKWLKLSNAKWCKWKNHNENFHGLRPHIIIVKVSCGRHYELYKQCEIFIILKKPHKSSQLIILQNC
jgi:hypothetical protein